MVGTKSKIMAAAAIAVCAWQSASADPLIKGAAAAIKPIGREIREQAESIWWGLTATQTDELRELLRDRVRIANRAQLEAAGIIDTPEARRQATEPLAELFRLTETVDSLIDAGQLESRAAEDGKKMMWIGRWRNRGEFQREWIETARADLAAIEQTGVWQALDAVGGDGAGIVMLFDESAFDASATPELLPSWAKWSVNTETLTVAALAELRMTVSHGDAPVVPAVMEQWIVRLSKLLQLTEALPGISDRFFADLRRAEIVEELTRYTMANRLGPAACGMALAIMPRMLSAKPIDVAITESNAMISLDVVRQRLIMAYPQYRFPWWLFGGHDRDENQSTRTAARHLLFPAFTVLPHGGGMWKVMTKGRFESMVVVISGLIADANVPTTRINGLRLLLALEVFRGQAGRYPESLGELVPGILQELPPNTVSNASWVYRRTEPSDADARGYLLYSVGSDGIDDGGKQSLDWSLGLVSRDYAAGNDYVVNPRSEDVR